MSDPYRLPDLHEPHKYLSIDSVCHVVLISLTALVTLILPPLLHRTLQAPLEDWLSDSTSGLIGYWMESVCSL